MLAAPSKASYGYQHLAQSAWPGRSPASGRCGPAGLYLLCALFNSMSSTRPFMYSARRSLNCSTDRARMSDVMSSQSARSARTCTKGLGT